MGKTFWPIVCDEQRLPGPDQAFDDINRFFKRNTGITSRDVYVSEGNRLAKGTKDRWPGREEDDASRVMPAAGLGTSLTHAIFDVAYLWSCFFVAAGRGRPRKSSI